MDRLIEHCGECGAVLESTEYDLCATCCDLIDEIDALAAWNQALDERDFDLAEAAWLEVLAAQRMAAYDASQELF